jgi:hypothetical protein
MFWLPVGFIAGLIVGYGLLRYVSQRDFLRAKTARKLDDREAVKLMSQLGFPLPEIPPKQSRLIPTPTKNSE